MGILVAPSLALLWLIKRFGVNSIYADDWDMVGVYEKAVAGTLHLSDLFMQHNEHRLFFPRIAMLALELPTHFSSLPVMFFSWLLAFGTATIIFYTFLSKFDVKNLQQLAFFIPVSLLIFSFRQFEAVLGWFNCQWYLLAFGVVAAFCLLEKSKSTDHWFGLSLLSAILASFSMLLGLLVWPAGLLQLLLSTKWFRQKNRIAIWSITGLAAIGLYLYGFDLFPSGNTLRSSRSLLSTGAYALAWIGGPFVWEPAYLAATVGAVICLLGVIVILQAYRLKLIGKNRLWVSMMAYAALAALVTGFGRGGLGWGEALVSRYTVVSVIGIIGLYLLAKSVSDKRNGRGRWSFGFHSVLALVMISLLVSTGAGLYAAQKLKNNDEMYAYILGTYKMQSDANLVRFLVADPVLVREDANFLEDHSLNVFSEPSFNPYGESASRIGNNTLFDFEISDVPNVNGCVEINSSAVDTVTITGWAIDSRANMVAGGVFITVDGNMQIPTLYGLSQQDVASHLGNKFLHSGFIAMFSSHYLAPGEHHLTLMVVGATFGYVYSPLGDLCIAIS
jgi:hypothetical protein